MEEIRSWLETFLWPEPDGKQRAKRVRILNSATRLFVRFGYRKTSIDEVAAAAGVAKGTVYLYYRNKAELVLHAIALEKMGYLDRLEPLLGGEKPASVKDQIDARLIIGAAVFGIGLGMTVPTLLDHGSRELQQRFIPPALRGDEIWCQGYSEPGSGSDLASLKTRAEDRGDYYLVNGSKIWTTGAQFANRMFCLVRTDPDAKPQAGISFLLVDMDTPGIQVAPLEMMNGELEFAEVFFDNVEVPADRILGELGGAQHHHVLHPLHRG